MKRKIFAMVLVMFMVLNLVPQGAFAADQSVPTLVEGSIELKVLGDYFKAGIPSVLFATTGGNSNEEYIAIAKFTSSSGSNDLYFTTTLNSMVYPLVDGKASIDFIPDIDASETYTTVEIAIMTTTEHNYQTPEIAFNNYYGTKYSSNINISCNKSISAQTKEISKNSFEYSENMFNQVDFIINNLPANSTAVLKHHITNDFTNDFLSNTAADGSLKIVDVNSGNNDAWSLGLGGQAENTTPSGTYSLTTYTTTSANNAFTVAINEYSNFTYNFANPALPATIAITNIEVEIPAAGSATFKNVPYILFNVDESALVANTSYSLLHAYSNSTTNYSPNYLPFEYIEKINGKYAVPVNIMSDLNHTYETIRLALVPTSEVIDENSYYNASFFYNLAFTENSDMLKANIKLFTNSVIETKTIEKTSNETSEPDGSKTVDFKIEGFSANSLIKLSDNNSFEANISSDENGVVNFTDIMLSNYNKYNYNLGHLTPDTAPNPPTHSIIELVTSHEGGNDYIITSISYNVAYDFTYGQPLPGQSLTWSDSTANGGTKNATFNTAFTAPTAVNGTSGGGTITYSVPANNGVATIDANSGAVTITGIGTTIVTATAALVDDTFAETSISYSLSVAQNSLTDSTIAINPASYTFTGSEITPTFTVSDNGKTLVKNTDYTVSVTSNTNVGTNTATVTITGINNYSDTKSETFSITQKTPDNAAPTKNFSISYSNTNEQTINLSDVIPVDAGTISSIAVTKSEGLSGNLVSTLSGDKTTKTVKYTLADNLTSGNINDSFVLTATVTTQNYTDIVVSITVTITDKNDQTNFSFANDTKAITYGAADYTLAASGAATGSTVTYKSSNENIATVEPTTGKVTILKAGSTVITATASSTADYNEASDSYTLTVNKANLTITAPTLSIYEGDPIPVLAPAYNGFVKGESETVFSITPLVNTAADNMIPADYATTLTNIPADSNYNITTNNGILTVIDRVSATLPPQESIPDNTNSNEPLVSLGDNVNLTDSSGTPVTETSFVRLSIAKTLSTSDLTALNNITLPDDSNTTKLYLEISLTSDEIKLTSTGEMEIFIPYSDIPPVTQSSNIKLIHLKSNSTYETIIPEMLANGIRFKTNGLSPFMIYQVNPTNANNSALAPLTGAVNNNFNASFYIILLFASILGMGALLVFKGKIISAIKK